MSNFPSRRAWFVSGLAALILLVLAGCSPAAPASSVESGAQKVVVFEGGDVTQGEIQEALGSSGIQPGSPQYEAAVQQVLPQILGREVAQAYARERGITVTDEEVDREIENLQEEIGAQLAAQAEAQGQQVTPEEGFQQALEQAGLTEEDLRDQIREGLPIQKVQERVIGDVAPTEEEVQAFYEENKETQFTTSEQRCVRQILFAEDQEQLANDVRQQLEEGADFGELAREFSQDPSSREQGGDLGCLGRGQTIPEIDEAIFGAEEGEIVGPVQTQFGYHVIEVTDIQPEEEQPLEEVAPQIEEQLTAEQQAEEFDRWLQQEIEERNVKYLPGFEPTPPEQPAGSPGEAPAGQPEP